MEWWYLPVDVLLFSLVPGPLISSTDLFPYQAWCVPLVAILASSQLRPWTESYIHLTCVQAKGFFFVKNTRHFITLPQNYNHYLVLILVFIFQSAHFILYLPRFPISSVFLQFLISLYWPRHLVALIFSFLIYFHFSNNFFHNLFTQLSQYFFSLFFFQFSLFS
jgi:hypothetical protein